MSRRSGHRAESHSGRLREIKEINRRRGKQTFEIHLERPTWPSNPPSPEGTPKSPDGTLTFEPPFKGPEGK